MFGLPRMPKSLRRNRSSTESPGILYVSQSEWRMEPSRKGDAAGSRKLSLDGCEFVLGNKIWFCAAREGYTGLHWFTAKFIDGRWGNWELADFKPEYQVGELHITADGQELYFHSSRPGGQGGYDLWLSKNVNGDWQEPVNFPPASIHRTQKAGLLSRRMEPNYGSRGQIGAPELWRSKRTEGGWSDPERIVCPLAAGASQGTTKEISTSQHHFFKDTNMLEADIYVAHPLP